MITRSECLDTAKEIVCKDREGTYGKPENSFKLIADLWSVYKGVEFTSHDVAAMMILLKIARISAGKYKSDNYIDIAGYAACACELRFPDAGKTCDDLTEEELENHFTDAGKMVDSKPKFRLEDHLVRYVMHCDTEENAKIFCRYLHEKGHDWIDGSLYISDTHYSLDKEKTCYEFESGLHGNLDDYKEMGFVILEFEDFDWSEYEEGKKKNG